MFAKRAKGKALRHLRQATEGNSREAKGRLAVREMEAGSRLRGDGKEDYCLWEGERVFFVMNGKI